MRQRAPKSEIAQLRVDVHESGVRPRARWTSCRIGQQLQFSTEELSSFCFAEWEPVVFDALLVAAAVEFCDRFLRRQMQRWRREFILRVPVHDSSLWNRGKVSSALCEALSFLTGDSWQFEFVSRRKPQEKPVQSHFRIASDSYAVIPFSQGMDSRAVAGLMSKDLQNRLVRVRLGSKASAAEGLATFGQPVAAVPYHVHLDRADSHESSNRSRGFKFATISGLTAYLLKAEKIIVPESGQGSLGPSLVPVGQVYEDYRNHPSFTDRMEVFFDALLNRRPRFEFPRLWYTKAETLRAFVTECEDGSSWRKTRSCWQQQGQSSVNHRLRQCGICAACMLRRQSVHGAGLAEPDETYVWENLKANSFEAGAATGFTGITCAMREYAIAGTLHLDHLASLHGTSEGSAAIDLSAIHLSESRGIARADAKSKLERMLSQHEREWRDFVDSLGRQSFVSTWAVHCR